MTPRARLDRLLLGVTVLLAWLGIVLQILVAARTAVNQGQSGLHGVLHALSYLTVLTNLLVALITTRQLVARGAPDWLTSPGMLAAAAVYIFVVGLTYSLLLRALWAPQGMHRIADTLLHDVTPVLYVLWWLVFAPKGGLGWYQPLKWTLYPLAYALFLVVLCVAIGRRSVRRLRAFEKWRFCN